MTSQLAWMPRGPFSPPTSHKAASLARGGGGFHCDSQAHGELGACHHCALQVSQAPGGPAVGLSHRVMLFGGERARSHAPFRTVPCWPRCVAGLPGREGPHLEAQLTLPLSTISFCRLVDVVTRSRMACQDQETCMSLLGWPSQLQNPPLGPQLAAHLHQVCTGIEDPVGGRRCGGEKREKGLQCGLEATGGARERPDLWPLHGPWALTPGARQCGPTGRRAAGTACSPSFLESSAVRWTDPLDLGDRGEPTSSWDRRDSPLVHLQFHARAGVASLVHHVLHQ